jgi:hypothetical protein
MIEQRRSTVMPLILAVTFLIGASTLLSPEKIATFRALYYLASESENEFLRYHENKEKEPAAKDYAQSELNRSAPIFALLYQQYGHSESLRRAVSLYRVAEREQKYEVPYSGTNPRGDITVTLNWLWNLKNPLFVEKYRVYIVVINNESDAALVLQGVTIAFETTTGRRIESVDLRSDPVLWDNVKNVPQSYYLQRVRRGEEGATRAVFQAFKDAIRYAFVDLGSYGIITIPFLHNIYTYLD